MTILRSVGEFTTARQAFRLVPFWIPFILAPPCVPFFLSRIASFLFSRRCCSYAFSFYFLAVRFEMSAASDALDEDRGWESLNRISRHRAPLSSIFLRFSRTSARLNDPQFCENATSTAIACPQRKSVRCKECLWRIKNVLRSVDLSRRLIHGKNCFFFLAEMSERLAR